MILCLQHLEASETCSGDINLGRQCEREANCACVKGLTSIKTAMSLCIKERKEREPT